jgi:hypothetical protein
MKTPRHWMAVLVMVFSVAIFSVGNYFVLTKLESVQAQVEAASPILGTVTAPAFMSPVLISFSLLLSALVLVRALKTR